MIGDTKKSHSDVSCSDKELDAKDKSTKICSDPVQNALGDFGWWQFWITFALSLLKFPIAWHQLAIIFLAAKTPFQCNDNYNATGHESMQSLLNVTDKCSARDPLTRDIVPCHRFTYDRSVFQETIITEVCKHALFVHLLTGINSIYNKYSFITVKSWLLWYLHKYYVIQTALNFRVTCTSQELNWYLCNTLTLTIIQGLKSGLHLISEVLNW